MNEEIKENKQKKALDEILKILKGKSYHEIEAIVNLIMYRIRTNLIY